MQPQPGPHADSDKPGDQPTPASPLDKPKDREPLSPIVYTAGFLSLALLLLAAGRFITLNESLAHLLTSVVVVAVVHLLDHYIFKNAARRELAELSVAIESKITANLQSALGGLTTKVSQTVETKSDETLLETKSAFDTLMKETQEQGQGLSKTIIGNISQSTRQALETLTAEVNTSFGKRADKLLDETKSALNEILHQQSASLQAMKASGIIAIYSSRADAAKAIASALRTPTKTEIRLLGISLNDFFLDQGELNGVWTELKELINGSVRLPDSAHLHVRVVMIDPNSFGAQMRSYAETQSDEFLVGRLSSDVLDAARALEKLERLANQKQEDTHVTFEARVYRLSPTMFLCHVDHTCFVQQYHYWTKRLKGTPIPVLEYSAQPTARDAYPMHHELGEHFDMVWDFASTPISEFLSRAGIGTDEAIGQCAVLNIFNDRAVAAKRIVQVLEKAENRVWVQGISLKSFFSNGPLTDKMFDLIATGRADIRVLLLDSTGEQAAYRSYRERLLQPQSLGLDFESFKGNQQERSQLSSDTMASVENLRTWAADLKRANPSWICKMQVRTYRSAPVCFMLAVDDRVLVEPYNYGKIGNKKEGASAPMVLGSDMPLMEFGSEPSRLYRDNYDKLRFPYSLHLDHFEYVFKQATPVDLLVPPQAVVTSA